MTFACGKCDKSFKLRGDYNRHVAKKIPCDPAGKEWYNTNGCICNGCDEKYASKRSLYNHRKICIKLGNDAKQELKNEINKEIEEKNKELEKKNKEIEEKNKVIEEKINKLEASEKEQKKNKVLEKINILEASIKEKDIIIDRLKQNYSQPVRIIDNIAKEKSKLGMVYFTQPDGYIGTNVYKIGCSRKPDLSRCIEGYGKNSELITFSQCIEPFKLESKIKQKFNQMFKLHHGKEYFEGNKNMMYAAFREVVDKYINETQHNDNNIAEDV